MPGLTSAIFFRNSLQAIISTVKPFGAKSRSHLQHYYQITLTIDNRVQQTIKMDSRKRPREDLPAANNFKTPEKRVSVVWRNRDFMQWDVEDTCRYMCQEGLGSLEERFRGWFLILPSQHIY